MLKMVVKCTLISLMAGSTIAQACEAEVQSMAKRMITGTNISEADMPVLNTASTYIKAAVELCKNGDAEAANEMLLKTDAELSKIGL